MRAGRRRLRRASRGIHQRSEGCSSIRPTAARRRSARRASPVLAARRPAGHASAARDNRSRRSARAHPRTPGRSSRSPRSSTMTRSRSPASAWSRVSVSPHATRNDRACSAACSSVASAATRGIRSRRASRTPAGSTTCAVAARCGPPSAAARARWSEPRSSTSSSGTRSGGCSASLTWSAPRSIGGCAACARPTRPRAAAKRSLPS
jgi:hypothetical protein